MKWFGKNWGGRVCDPKKHAETPVNDTCSYCEEPIKKDDQGLLIPCAFQDDDLPPDVVYHIDCFLESINGNWIK